MIREDISAGALKQFNIGEFSASAGILCIERFQHLSTPTITRVKDFLTSAVVSFLQAVRLFKESFLLQLSHRSEIDKVIKLGRLDLGRIDGT